MHKFFDKYGKPLMAVFMAFLMVTFLLPMAGRYTGGGRGQVIGTVGGEKLYGQDLDNARSAWQMLTRISIPTQPSPGQEPQSRSIAFALGPFAYQQINQNPLLFLLLQKEAERMGVSVSQDRLNEELTNELASAMTGDARHQSNVREAVRELLLVRDAFVRASSAVKISQPLVKHELAELGQSITIKVSEINTAGYLSKVPAPTPEQLKQQFEKYADVVGGQPSAENPFGFGYKYPDRVKVQYIVTPEADVRKSVQSSKSAYDWKVDAQKYYLQHESDYQTTTEPSSSKPFDLSASSRPTTAPTTQPFAAVEKEITDQLIETQVQQKLSQIQDYITTTMASDYVNFHSATAAQGSSAGPSSTSAPAPASSLGPAYASVEYLKKLAAAVQDQFHVLPTVVSIQDKWLDFDELARQPGIGQAHREDGIPFNSYVIGLTAPFLAAEHRTENNTLQLNQPSQPMTDANNSVYIARVTAAEPAHAPPSLSDVQAQVTEDVKKLEAFKLAEADAQKLLDAARHEGLESAGAQQKHPAVTVGPLTNRPQPVPTLNLSDASAAQFTNDAFKLLSTPTSRPSGEPVRMIPLQKDGRIFVAELGNVQAMWNEKSLPIEQAQLHIQMGNQFAQELSRDWFDFGAVKTRTQWQANENYKESQPGPSQPPPPPGPML
jgi:hypothetical protein